MLFLFCKAGEIMLKVFQSQNNTTSLSIVPIKSSSFLSLSAVNAASGHFLFFCSSCAFFTWTDIEEAPPLVHAVPHTEDLFQPGRKRQCRPHHELPTCHVLRPPGETTESKKIHKATVDDVESSFNIPPVDISTDNDKL